MRSSSRRRRNGKGFSHSSSIRITSSNDHLQDLFARSSFQRPLFSRIISAESRARGAGYARAKRERVFARRRKVARRKRPTSRGRVIISLEPSKRVVEASSGASSIVAGFSYVDAARLISYSIISSARHSYSHRTCPRTSFSHVPHRSCP